MKARLRSTAHVAFALFVSACVAGGAEMPQASDGLSDAGTMLDGSADHTFAAAEFRERSASGYPYCSCEDRDSDHDGWGWIEAESLSCIVRGSAADPGPEPGAAALEEQSANGYPYCGCDDEDPDNDGWGWIEAEAQSCITRGSPIDPGPEEGSPEPPGDGPLGGACASFGRGESLGNIARSSLTEISGAVASRTQPGVLFVHNDSGEPYARFFAVGVDGRDLGRFGLDGASFNDWEDIALGPGPVPGQSYVYLADIGDNPRRRSRIEVYRVPEPTVGSDQTLYGAAKLRLRYPDGSHDAETLLVHPSSGDIYVVTKEGDGRSRIFVARSPVSAEATTTLVRVGTVDVGGLATGGDISASGDLVVLRTYTEILAFPVSPSQTLEAALSGRPVRNTPRTERQGEALAISPDGLGLFTISEDSHPPAYFYPAACGG